MKLRKSLLAAAAVAAAAMAASASHAAVIAHVDAGYQFDTTTMTFVNDSGLNFDDVQISATGPFGAGSEDLGAVLAGGSVGVPFGNFGGGPFGFDYDDTNPGADGCGAACDSTYRVAVTIGANTVYSNFFSPSTNLSGGVVDFTGNHFDNDIQATRVAEVGGVPEPATWGLMLLGFAGVGAAVRSRKAAAALA